MKTSRDFILREIAGEYILVPTGEAAVRLNGLIALNELGCFIFQTLQTEQTEQTLVDAIVAEYNVTREEAAADAQAFVQQLAQDGVLAEDD